MARHNIEEDPGIMTLQEKIKGYYEACHYETHKNSKYPSVVVARRTDVTGSSEVTLLWVQEEVPDRPDRAREFKILAEFGDLRNLYPRAAAGWFVCYTREGLSRDFSRDAKSQGFSVREESLFFDAEFRSEVNKEAKDVSTELRREAEQFRARRVSQPFQQLTSEGAFLASGEDLAARLSVDLNKSHSEPKIRIVVGPAGAGKSVAFAVLFASLYGPFQEAKAKKGKQTACRPVPILPKHISRIRGNTFSGVLDTFLQTEVARPIGADGLNWMLDNGIVQLLVDGLDEVLATDDTFFETFLLDRLTIPGGRGRVTICVRDSLFSTCASLAEFLENARDQVEVFHLDKWNFTTKEAFARKRFAGDDLTVTGFLEAVQGHGQARELSDNPYFCEVLADTYKSDGLPQFLSAYSLCELALRKLISREYEKNLILESQMTIDNVWDFLEAAAAENLFAGFGGFRSTNFGFNAETFSAPGMSVDQTDQLVMRLMQLPVFTKSTNETKVAFVHEILAFYLLARSLVRGLEARPDFFASSMDNPSLLARRMLLQLVSELIAARSIQDKLWTLLAATFLPDAAFRTILQIAILADPGELPKPIRERQLSNKNLAGLRFQRLNLQETRFDNSDLTNVEFKECDLRNSSFKGCIIQNTHFDLQGHDMDGVKFGDYFSVYSVKLGARYFDEPNRAAEAIADFIREEKPLTSPCPTALQMRFLLSKFIRPNGGFRRDSIDLRGFLHGNASPAQLTIWIY